MSKVKRIISIGFTFILMLCMSICFTACQEDYYPEYESGYFKYAVKTEKGGTKKAYLIGLTESGLKQKFLVYPEKIEGIDVYGIGYERRQLVNGVDPVGFFMDLN